MDCLKNDPTRWFQEHIQARSKDTRRTRRGQRAVLLCLARFRMPHTGARRVRCARCARCSVSGASGVSPLQHHPASERVGSHHLLVSTRGDQTWHTKRIGLGGKARKGKRTKMRNPGWKSGHSASPPQPRQPRQPRRPPPHPLDPSASWSAARRQSIIPYGCGQGRFLSLSHRVLNALQQLSTSLFRRRSDVEQRTEKRGPGQEGLRFRPRHLQCLLSHWSDPQWATHAPT